MTDTREEQVGFSTLGKQHRMHREELNSGSEGKMAQATSEFTKAFLAVSTSLMGGILGCFLKVGHSQKRLGKRKFSRE